MIYFTAALDEYVISNLQEFDGHKFFDVTKEDLKLGKDKSEKEADKKVKVRCSRRPARLCFLHPSRRRLFCFSTSVWMHRSSSRSDCTMPQGEYKGLTKWWKEQLVSEVRDVKVSKRLHNTPLIVVTSKFGWSANMERIMKAQASTFPAFHAILFS